LVFQCRPLCPDNALGLYLGVVNDDDEDALLGAASGATFGHFPELFRLFGLATIFSAKRKKIIGGNASASPLMPFLSPPRNSHGK